MNEHKVRRLHLRHTVLEAEEHEPSAFEPRSAPDVDTAQVARALTTGRHETLPPAAILYLQREAGNAGVAHMLGGEPRLATRAQSGPVLQRARPASGRRAAGRGKPGPRAVAAKRSVPWDEALKVLDAIGYILLNPGTYVIEEGGYAHETTALAQAKDVPERWQPLLREWWLIATGKVRDASGVEVSYYGEDLAVHIELAEARTEPLTKTLLAEGDETTGPWLAKNYASPVKALRARAASEAVSAAIGTIREKAAGGKLDVSAMSELAQIQVGAVAALRAIRALMTAAQRAGSANVAAAKNLDRLFEERLGGVKLPPSLDTTRAMDFQGALLHLQGGLNLVQAISNIADPERRKKVYLEHVDRFGPAAGGMEITKNIGWFVSGATSIATAGTFAVAKVLGKADLAAKALTSGSEALGNINYALNVLGVVHGILILADEEATREEKLEAGVELVTSGLGVAAKFSSVLAAPVAAATLTVSVNFYMFKALLSEGMQGYAGLIALGMNACYADMQRTARYISQQAMSYAAALDLKDVITEPDQAAALATQTEALRSNLVSMLREFIDRATLTSGGRNEDPGTYEVLRRRFIPLKAAKLETDEQVIAFTRRLLETVAWAQAGAQNIFKDQVEYGWSHH